MSQDVKVQVLSSALLDWVRHRIKQWFYCGAASGVYSRSRGATAAKDLIQVPQWLEGGELPITIREALVSPERLQGLISAQNATYRAIAALLRRDGALDFGSGEPITAAHYFEEKIENHHIFPKDWCKRQGIHRDLYNSIVNRTPLTAKTNNFLRGNAPSEYLLKLQQQGISPQRMDEILRSHCIEPATLRRDDFEGFFAQRTEALLERISQAMGKGLTGKKEY